MQLDHDDRVVSLKIVYYGPALSGKTTNLQALRDCLPRGSVGRLVTLETRDRRTLFLDLLPVVFHTATAYRVRIRLLTVPGQVMHEATRRVLLQDVDGVVFVADSQIRETTTNNASFRELREVLVDDVPLVLQFNKRDLPAVRSDDELGRLATSRRLPVVGAVALRGEGVRETLARVLALVWRRQAAAHGLEALLGVDEAGFVDRVLGTMATP
ncbi:MAG: GTPase domain-containing protein [Myxococcales bacterium]|nr:GTPase domain-containing protein [Myxococcales bacterium]